MAGEKETYPASVVLLSPLPRTTIFAALVDPASRGERLVPDPMETIENALVVGGILWLAQTILDNLSIPGKLDEWIRQVQLTEDIEKFRTEIERVETVVAAVKGRATGNKPLARSLARVRELMYDADDVVDELDYFRLQQEAEAGETSGANNDPDGTDLDGAELVADGTGDNPGIPSTSKKRKRKNQCKAWQHFEEKRDENGKLYEARCKFCRALIKCGGTTGSRGLTKHIETKHGHLANECIPNDIADATLHSVISTRMRTDEASTLNITADTYHWNKADASKKINQITLELQGLRGTVTEFLKDSVASLDQYQSNTLDTRLRTTSLIPRKVYGRDKKKNYIIRVITAAESDVITVLPIVGIAGVGKTALAQLVYNDPKVERQFERIWVCVSYDFDEVTLTREMLDFYQGRNGESPKIKYKHQGISGLGSLQEILKAHLQYQSKRFLLILDDIWDNMDDFRWKRLLLPLQSSHVKGNVILVTTRDLSVAQRIGTEESIKLDVLEEDDFWLLYKSFAFGGDNYGELPCLNDIGREIAEKLSGNPLAAETAGKILRECLDLEHWSRILKNEDWKSLQLRGGIMSALRLSYDRLPYHLQQCFLYCSIFPSTYEFLAKDLVRTWIALGFVKRTDSNKKLQELGRECLTNLVNLGFLEQYYKKRRGISGKGCYVKCCGIMHDFGRLVSKTEYATIDGLEFNKILPTIRHLSIVHNKKFQENLQSIFEQAGKLRTLVLLLDDFRHQDYANYFMSCFHDMLPKAQNLRLLQISIAPSYNSYSFQGSFVSPVHLRRLKLEFRNIFNDFPQALRKWYHIQVLDLDKSTTLTPTIGMDHLASGSVYSGIIGKLTSLQELNCASYDITELASMSNLVQLRVYMLKNIITRDVAYGARLRDKPDLETLKLSWKNNLSEDECDIQEDSSAEDECDSEEYSSAEDDCDIQKESSAEDECDIEEESSTVNGYNNSLSYEHFADTESDVLEGLEPHRSLKHLQILGYIGAKSPSWLGVSDSCLRTLHLEDCGEWKELNFLRSLRFLSKLKLRNMPDVKGVSVPSSLVELRLIKMPNLKRCSCDSLKDLNFTLRVLEIKICRKIKFFSLFGSSEIEQNLCLSHLKKLTIHDCPNLMVSHPLPPSRICKLYITGVSKLPMIEGSPDEELILAGEFSYNPTKPSTNILAFSNLKFLRRFEIVDVDYPIFFSLEGFRELINLESLVIHHCKHLSSSNAPQKHTYEDVAPENIKDLPSLKSLSISFSKICGMWLSVLLLNVQALEELYIHICDQITGLSIENELSNIKSAPEASSSAEADDVVTGSSLDGLIHIPSKLVSSLKKMAFTCCFKETYRGDNEVFSKLTSLEELTICHCPGLDSSCMRKDGNDEHANRRWLLPQSLVKLVIETFDSETFRLCFPGHPTDLKKLNIEVSPCLESLQPHYCKALEELLINSCESLTRLEVPPSLEKLGNLNGVERLLRLQINRFDDYSSLTTSFNKEHLMEIRYSTSANKLNVTRLTEEQESTVQLLKSLEFLCLEFGVKDLSFGQHNLPFLKGLVTGSCGVISRLSEQGLPPSLKTLNISLLRRH